MQTSSRYDQGTSISKEDDSFCLIGTESVFCAVWDGVSEAYNKEKPRKLFSGQTGTQVLNDIIKDTLSNTNVLTQNIVKTVQELNNQIRKFREDASLTNMGPARVPGVTFAAVRINPENNIIEIVSIGDARVLYHTKNAEIHITPNQLKNHDAEMYVLIEKYMAESAKELMVDFKRADFATFAEVRQKMWLKFFEPLCAARNERCNNRDHKFGYGLLNGDPEAEKMLFSAKTCCKNLKPLLLFTDGIVPFHGTKDMTDRAIAQKMLSIYYIKGLDGILDWAQNLEKAYAPIQHIDYAEKTIISVEF